MKKITALLLSAMLLLLAFSGLASAATGKPPITVWAGDQKVAFDAPPMITNGTTYVEFKALFNVLGFRVAYDAKSKTITGTSASVTLTLNVASGAATVNGQASAKSVQLIVQEGRTLVPLRFIGESTGMLVSWDSAAQTVKISAKGPTAADIKELQAYLARMDAYDTASDLEGTLSLIAPGSPFYAAVKAQGEAKEGDPVVRTTSKLMDIPTFTSSSAVIIVSQHSAKESGGFYLDNDCVLKIELVRGPNKQWLLSGLELQKMEYVNTDEATSHEADVPADDKAAILAVVDQQTKTSNDEDLDGYKATIDPNVPGLDQTMAATKQTMDTYDLKYTNEVVRIVDYTATEAVVYVVQTVEKVNGPAFQNFRLSIASTYRKTADGKWLDAGEGKLLKVEPLSAV
ncbi:copper amine oxidase N-terminal domain-containing protein [Paenibacillus rhizovicinus]|uniref:Copper amine oxidase N-terminal domain-containing protein n=1 Tax=Paenibacillus rhizovicinus TaxID=2704463 RepID=A0A6C0P173_9BACL|nr:copper amine oxidase N-terminal domain-containing protein [Paenibacillus rhizovicinus]QHW31653.1 copper amine oxidase N-terminal domain-containing protein [Paenibacillus rhizovicinus]